jgi:hypothetical protein
MLGGPPAPEFVTQHPATDAFDTKKHQNMKKDNNPEAFVTK